MNLIQFCLGIDRNAEKEHFYEAVVQKLGKDNIRACFSKQVLKSLKTAYISNPNDKKLKEDLLQTAGYMVMPGTARALRVDTSFKRLLRQFRIDICSPEESYEILLAFLRAETK